MRFLIRGDKRLGRRSIPIACLTAFLVLTASIAEAQPARTYKVTSGDTLSHIAKKNLGNARKWVPLYKANRKVLGSNPHRIYPGQVLVLTAGEGKVARQSAAKQKPLPVAIEVAPKPLASTSEAPALPGIESSPLEVPSAPIAELPVTVPADASFLQTELPSETLAGPLELTLPDKPALEPLANPWVAAGASALFPGAGQALMGDWARSGLYVGATAVLYGTALYGLNSNNSLLARTSSAALLGISLVSPIDAFFGASIQSKPAPEAPRKEARK